MTDQDDQDHRREHQSLVHARRTRVVVALIGLVLSLGVPVVVLSGGPVPTVDGHAIGSLADPAGLGVTGALPGEPLPGEAVPGDGVPSTGIPSTGIPSTGDPAVAVFDGYASTGHPGIPTPPNLPDGPLGIPGAVLDAYQFAQRMLAATRPGCHLSWSVLAGIGRIESNHASDGRVDAFGNTLGPILGPRLDGSPGMAAIPDTDHGQLDGDPVWDRAVGPMQFIPSSWRAYGVDGNGDGVANPNNIYDSTITTGLYLCAGGSDLSNPAQLQAAVFRYNHSATYVDIVLGWAQAYLTGVVPVPSAQGPMPPGTNGNGGRLVVPGATALAAVAPAASAQPIPLAVTAPARTSGAPPPPPVPTTALTTTSSSPALATSTSPTTTPPTAQSTSPAPPRPITTTTLPTPPMPATPATPPMPPTPATPPMPTTTTSSAAPTPPA